MENEMDLTLKLGLPNPTVELSLHSPTSDQGANVVDGGRGNNNNNSGRGDNDNNGGRGDNNNDGGEISNLRRTLLGEDVVMDDDEGARNNVDVNIRVYNYIFRMFAGRPNTLNFNPFPMSPSPPPAPVTPPASDYVMLDVPARRAHRNNSLSMAHARDANINARWRRGCGGFCGGRIEGPRKCTNINCNVLTTPMWRKGPLGPKSLCNACGIKFRKEQEKKSKRN